MYLILSIDNASVSGKYGVLTTSFISLCLTQMCMPLRPFMCGYFHHIWTFRFPAAATTSYIIALVLPALPHSLYLPPFMWCYLRLDVSFAHLCVVISTYRQHLHILQANGHELIGGSHRAVMSRASILHYPLLIQLVQSITSLKAHPLELLTSITSLKAHPLSVWY